MDTTRSCEVNMIGYFPSQRPDENLYSLTCEYKKRLQSRSDKEVSKELFGVECVHDMVDLPCRLQYLERQIPKELGITIDYLLWQTTALAYFSPFLTTDEFSALLEAMKGRPADARALFTNFRKGPNMSPRFLRICIECSIEDRSSISCGEETYWRRSYQVPCAHMCDQHEIALAQTAVSRGKTVTYSYIAAEEAFVQTRSAAKIRPSDRDTLLWLSQQAKWLLEHPQEPLDRERLRNAYLYQLHIAGFASVGGSVKMDKLSVAIVKKYRRTRLCDSLNMKFEQEHVTRWMRRVISGKASTTEHLMAMHFLEVPVSSMIASLATPIWFENGPWPCLNPVCGKFNQDSIECHNLQAIQGKMIGTFSCRCGFAYRRIGPDKEGQGRYMPYRAIQNEAFDDAFSRMCGQQQISLTAIKDQLFTSYSELMRSAMRLGLDSGARKREFASHGGSAYPTNVDRSLKFEKQQARKRKDLQEWMKQHPTATRSEINIGAAGATRWLRRCDHEWLIAQLGTVSSAHKNPSIAIGIRCSQISRVKLLKRDEHFAAIVPAVARSLYSRPGRPRRVSPTQILTHIGLPNGLSSCWKEFKSTRAALEKYSESAPQCAVRRLRWLVDKSKCTGKRWCLPTLLYRAGIRNSDWIGQYAFVAIAVASAQRELGI